MSQTLASVPCAFAGALADDAAGVPAGADTGVFAEESGFAAAFAESFLATCLATSAAFFLSRPPICAPAGKLPDESNRVARMVIRSVVMSVAS